MKKPYINDPDKLWTPVSFAVAMKKYADYLEAENLALAKKHADSDTKVDLLEKRVKVLQEGLTEIKAKTIYPLREKDLVAIRLILDELSEDGK